jgi:hypothetical protein
LSGSTVIASANRSNSIPPLRRILWDVWPE